MNYVIDASAVPSSAQLLDSHEKLFAPHIIDLEILTIVRRGVLQGTLTVAEADASLDRWSRNSIQRCDHRSLLTRIWELRNNITSYDAAYVALAERLQIPLVTADKRLAKAAAPYCEIVIVE